MLNITPQKINELTDNASQEVQDIIIGDDIDKTTAILGKIYLLPISKYVLFKNIIILTLLGAIEPTDVVDVLSSELDISSDIAQKIALDLEKSIFEKARIKLIGKKSTDLVTLTFDKEGEKEELRKKIMDTTKRESALTKPQSSGNVQTKSKILTPGSRSQLLEQLQVLDQIPNDDEVAARLNHIQEQIRILEEKQNEGALQISPEQEEAIFGDKGDDAVPAVARAASYSKAPTKYNVDPYREVAGV